MITTSVVMIFLSMGYLFIDWVEDGPVFTFFYSLPDRLIRRKPLIPPTRISLPVQIESYRTGKSSTVVNDGWDVTEVVRAYRPKIVPDDLRYEFYRTLQLGDLYVSAETDVLYCRDGDEVYTSNVDMSRLNLDRAITSAAGDIYESVRTDRKARQKKIDAERRVEELLTRRPDKLPRIGKPVPWLDD